MTCIYLVAGNDREVATYIHSPDNNASLLETGFIIVRKPEDFHRANYPIVMLIGTFEQRADISEIRAEMRTRFARINYA